MLLMINNFTSGNCYIKPGDIIKVPAPWQRMPTSTIVPTEIRPGTVIDYIVESGANLHTVAFWFRSTPERIIAETNRYRTANGITPLLSDTTPLFIGELQGAGEHRHTGPLAIATRTMTLTNTLIRYKTATDAVIASVFCYFIETRLTQKSEISEISSKSRGKNQ